MLNGTNLFEVMLAKPPEELGSWFYGNMVKQGARATHPDQSLRSPTALTLSCELEAGRMAG